MKDFVHLHCHSDYSQLDGCATVEAYVKSAAERGYRAVAITDHGTMRGAYKLQEECNKSGIKALHGIEFYICDDIERKGLTEEEKKEAVAGIDGKAEQKKAKKELEEKLGVNKRYHITAWAMNNEGLRNLYRLSSIGWDDGYYYKPRIDLDLLERYNSGILLGSGCIGSILNDAIHNKQHLRAESLLDRLCSVFGDRLYLEIMPHEFERQIATNNEIVRIHRKYGNKLIATQDSHYCSEDDVRFYEVMLAMNTQSKLSDEDRFKFEGDSYWYKTRKEMKESFNSHGIDKKYIIDSLNNTIEFADRCDAKIEIDPLKCLLPNVHIPEEFENENQYFLHLVKEGYRNRQIAKRAVAYSRQAGIAEDEAKAIYRKRMKHELGVLLKSGFVRYFLVIRDIFRFADEAGIAYGCGRGSAAASLIGYLIGITHVDPIQHNLMFERFIMEDRQDYPDIDCDFQHDRRDEIFDYLIRTYGEKQVAQISTHGTMAAKLAFKDVARTYDVPFSVANSLSMAIDSKEEDAIQKALDENDRMKEFNEKYPEVIEFAKKTEGLMKSVGLHAAGIVVSPRPITDIAPVEVRRPAGKAIKCVAFDLKGVEGVGLLKIDILGLKTVTVIADAVKAIKENGNELILEDVPLDDQETIDGFTELDFVGVFQYDSSSSYAVCKGLKFKWFDDLAVITAINRPGAIAFAEEFKKRRANEELAKKHIYHEKITEITKDAEGLMVFQEHLIKIAMEIAGFSAAEADVLRKAVGKKKMELLKSLGDKFLEGCEKHTPDMPKETAEALFGQITKAGRYSFNRAHSICYGLLAYWTMYLKKHYPIEFYWALMKNSTDQTAIHRYTRDAKRKGIETAFPDVNISGYDIAIDRKANSIRASLGDIKGLGPAAVKAIVEGDKPYTSFVDFLQKVKGRAVTVRTMYSLIESGALDSLLPNPRYARKNIQQLWELAKKKDWDAIAEELETSKTKLKWNKNKRLQISAVVNPLALPQHAYIIWESFLHKHIAIPFSTVTDELLSADGMKAVVGSIISWKEREVGDSADSNMSSDKKAIMGWGKQWYKIALDGLDKNINVKLKWDLLPHWKDTVEKDKAVLVVGDYTQKYQMLNAHYIIDIKELSNAIKNKLDLNIWQQLAVRHPAKIYEWKDKKERSNALRNLEKLAIKKSGRFTIVGVVTYLHEFFDRNDGLMARFNLAGANGNISVLSFASSWEQFRDKLRYGSFVKLQLKKLDGKEFLLEAKNGVMELL